MIDTHATRKDATSRAQRGFTLLEVLIAVVVLSIGLLGIATLQMTGVKQTHNSQLRASAAALAQEMADRMRANPSAAENGDYNVGAPGAPHAGMPTTLDEDCETNECTAPEMTTWDLVQWNDPNDVFPGAGLDDALPGGVGMVCIDSTPNDGDASNWQCDYAGNVYAVKVQWTDRALDAEEAGAIGGDTQTKTFAMRVRP